MFPTITFLGRTFGTYAIMAVAAAILIGFLLCRKVRRQKLDDNDAIIFLLIVAGGVFLGGHLLYGITNLSLLPKAFQAKSFLQGVKILGVIFGGMVFYGGLFGGFAAGAVAIKLKKLNGVVYGDAMAPLVPLFHAFARIGCFLGGCCYGVESEFGIIVRDNPLVPDLNDVRRFPVQLLESVCCFLLFFFLEWLYRRLWEKPNKAGNGSGKMEFLRGKLLLVYASLYPIVRFFDEFLRGDKIRGFLFNGALSTSQFISILLFTVSLILWIISFKKLSKSSKYKN